MRIIGNAGKAREVQAVASGVLPSGVPVVVNADGTVSVVGSSGANLSPSPISSSVATFNAGGTTQNIKVSSDPNNNGKFVVIYKDLANSGYGTAVVGTVSGASVSFGSEVVFKSSEIAGVDLSFDPNTSNKFVVTYQANDAPYYCSVKVGTISGTTISFGSEYTVSDSNLPLVAFDPSSANKFVFAYSDASYVGKALIGTVSGTSISFGSASTYESSPVYQNTIAADPNNAGKFIVAYQDSNNSSYGTAVVGTISGTSISFGTSSVFNSGNTASLSSAFDPNNSGKLAISYRNYANSQYGTAVIGTVSGSSVTFGSPVVFNAGQTEVTSVSFDENNNNVFAVGYEDIPDSYYGKVVFGTISGTSVSFGNEVAFNEARTDFLSIAFDPNQTSSLFIAYRDGADSSKGKAILATATNLTSDNYIGMSGGVVTGSVSAVGTPAVSSTVQSSYFGSTFDSNSNKVVVTYWDQTNSKGMAVVGTVSGTSISFGTPVEYSSQSAFTYSQAVVFDSNSNKVVISYVDSGGSSYGTAIVGTVSGTSISFGTAVVFESASTAFPQATFDSTNNKVVIIYEDGGDSDKGKAVVGTVSGTSISFGSPVTFEEGLTAYPSVAYDTNAQKVVIAFRDRSASDHGKAIVGTVSGSSISFGSAVTFNAADSNYNIIVYDASAQKLVIYYQDTAATSMKAIVGTVSGTSISFGTATEFSASNSANMSATYDASASKTVVFYRSAINSNYGTYNVGTISGTSISFSDPIVFEEADSRFTTATYDSGNEKVIVSYEDVGNSQYATSTVINVGYINRGQVADGGNAEINIKGNVSTNQVGLTAGQSYYVQTDGTLSTTAGDPSVFAGTAVAATKLIVKG
jgi:hypothetical protein